jgi:hypothetical protein
LDHSPCKKQCRFYEGTQRDNDKEDLLSPAKLLLKKSSTLLRHDSRDAEESHKIQLQIRQIVRSASEAIKSENLRLNGQKVVVTEFSLFHWIAQTYGLDLNDWSNQCP